MLEPRLRVAGTQLHRAEVRVGPHVPPQVRVVRHRARLDHELAAARSTRPSSRTAAGSRRAAAGRKIGVREDFRPVGPPAPERRVGRQREQDRDVHPHAVRDVDRLLGVVDADVHVQAEQQLLARDEPQHVDDLAVAVALHDALVLPVRERVGRRGADREALRLGGLAHAPAQLLELAAPPRRRCGTRRWRSRARTGSARASPGPRSRAGPPRSSPRSPGTRSIDFGVDDHQLLLDPEGVGRACEVVLHGAATIAPVTAS